MSATERKMKVYLNYFSKIWQHYLLLIDTSRVVREHCEERPTTTLENLKEVAKCPAVHQH